MTTFELDDNEIVLLARACKYIARTKLSDEHTKDFMKKLLLNIYIPDQGVTNAISNETGTSSK